MARSLLPWLLALALAGCANPLARPMLGTAHYAGKRFLDLTGEFRSIAVAPAGGRVAFRGHDGPDAFPLFVADVDGQVRQVAPTRHRDELISWAADGGSLCYLDSVPRPDGMLDGGTIQHLDLGTGTVRQAMYAVPLLGFFLSPDGRRLLVAGESNLTRRIIPDRRNHLVDLPGGEPRAIAGALLPAADARWAPDGARIALMLSQAERGNAPVKLQIVAGPDFAEAQSSEATWRREYTGFAWDGPQAVRVAEVVVGDALVVSRFDATGQPLGEARHPLDRPPAGTRWTYQRPLFSADGRRILITRVVSDPETSEHRGPREHLIADGGAPRLLPATPEDVEAIGWVDDRRILALTGFFVDRKPHLIDAGDYLP